MLNRLDPVGIINHELLLTFMRFEGFILGSGKAVFGFVGIGPLLDHFFVGSLFVVDISCNACHPHSATDNDGVASLVEIDQIGRAKKEGPTFPFHFDDREVKGTRWRALRNVSHGYILALDEFERQGHEGVDVPVQELIGVPILAYNFYKKLRGQKGFASQRIFVGQIVDDANVVIQGELLNEIGSTLA